MLEKKHHHTIQRNLFMGVVSLGLLLTGIAIIWLTTLKVPDLRSFENRMIAKSSRVYDRTGQVLLYDFHQDVKRTVVPFSDMSSYVKNATVAIEDSEFYSHSGIRLKSILRALYVDITGGSIAQGGSTITQQVVKNALLDQKKTITRKLKEIILALKVERQLSKEEILSLYLNEAPYGGNLYGVEEASQTYFDKKASDLTLAESAYLAAIPQAPSYYSPFGQHRDKLEERKNVVLSRMRELGLITNEEYMRAGQEKVTWGSEETKGIKAPHFVFFVKDYLEEKYGPDVLETGGLKITTTLDYTMQEKAEEIVKRRALENEKSKGAENAGLVALDPKTGQILTMVGSRDFFDKEIDGQYNIATAKRQPGSSFKPFVYALSFIKGYTPDTVLFDVPTEFNSSCSPYGVGTNCYMPDNYGGGFSGPLTVHAALARSINIPAVKMLYLVGVNNALKFANDMGITTLGSANTYGLTLVLGGGEVRLLDMVSAYGVFATNGARHPYTPVLKVEDGDSNTLEEYKQNDGVQLFPKNIALMISNILSDNVARTPTFGANSPMVVSGHDVAVKTGTTNNSKDAWMVGYTPSLVVGTWGGNNDNRSMKKGIVSYQVVGPMWNEFMTSVLQNIPNEPFESPVKPDGYDSLKPILRGLWQGGDSYVIDTVSGKLATEYTPTEKRKEIVIPNIHDILYWVDKDNPNGPKPENPYNDPQFKNWETAVQNWWATHAGQYSIGWSGIKPTQYDDIHTQEKKPIINISTPVNGSVVNTEEPVVVSVQGTGIYPLIKIDVFVNNVYIGSSQEGSTHFTFVPGTLNNLQQTNELRIVGYDSVYNNNEAKTFFNVNN